MGLSAIQKAFRISDRLWSSAEEYAAAAVMGCMVLLPIIDAAFRKACNYSLPGIDSYVSHATLWIAFIGASLAARNDSHLRLSTGRRAGSGSFVYAARVFYYAASAAVAIVFAAAAAQLVAVELSAPFCVAPFLPTWAAQIPMPVFMGIIAIRFITKAPTGVSGRFAIAGAAALVLLSVLVPVESRHLLVLPGLGALVIAVAFGAPLFVGLGGAALFLFFQNGIPLSAVPSEVYRIVSSPVLPTIPLFTLAGYVLARGGASQRLVHLFRALFGWLPGGVAIAAVIVCAFFTTFTGASSVTIIALGGLLYPVLVSERYPERFSLGLITASGSVGILFPPALPIILYGVIAATPINKLFLAGIAPGMALVILMSLYGVYIYRKSGSAVERFSFDEIIKAVSAAKWDLLIPAIIIVGIFGGLTTIVEAAALTALYAVVLECVIHRRSGLAGGLYDAVVECSRLVGGVLIILGCAFGLTNYLIDAQVPSALFDWMQRSVSSPVVFLLLLNLCLVVVGCMMDIFSALVVVVPIVLPIATSYGIDPVHLGIIFLVNLELGYLTPPVGLNLFFSAYRFNKPLPEVYQTVWPFLFMRLIIVGIVTYIPSFSRMFI